MKTKKIVSLLLAIIMVVGLLPMSALAESGLIGSVVGNRFVDKNAVPEKSYQYTVRGADGSTQVVTVLGKNTTTGNKLVPTGWKAGDVYYTRVKDVSKATSSSGATYLIVANDGGKDYAVKSNYTSVFNVSVTTDPEKGEIIKVPNSQDSYKADEWEIEADGSYRCFKNSNGSYLTTTRKEHTGGKGTIGKPWKNTYSIAFGSGADRWEFVNNTDTFRSFHYYDYIHYTWDIYPWDTASLRVNKNGGSVITKCSDNTIAGDATYFKLYQRQDPIKDTEYHIDTTDLENLIKAAKTRVEYEKTYTTESWTNFAAALSQAENAVAANKGVVYVGDAVANAKLDEINEKHIHLKNMMDALILDIGLGECVTPTIHWQRTFDTVNSGTGEVITDITPLVKPDFSKIIWKWDTPYKNGSSEGSCIRDLRVGAQEGTNNINTVWDYGTYENGNVKGQVAGNPKNAVAGVKAATWHHRGTDSWPMSSARRFSGTFVWPHGYTLNDKAQIVSANDANYKEIYDHINSYKDAEPGSSGRQMYERYKNSKVFAVNDNMYVFISKASENIKDWTHDEAMEHLAFWTGTDGKGVWSNVGSSDDGGRTTPATFHNRAATPAFHENLPNMGDVISGSASPKLSSATLEKMKFADGWYSLVDTSSCVMTTLKNVYGANEKLDGELMRIDIIALDNSGDGGMDQPILKICKPSVDDVPVTVRYWLGSVGGKDLGFSTFYTTDKATINLSAGTNVNNLDYKYAAAVAAAPQDANVEKGVQVQENYLVDKKKTNVIDVVYKGSLAGIEYLTYDFAGKNILHYEDKLTSSPIESVSIEGLAGATASVNAENGHIIDIAYTPKTAVGKVEAFKLVVNRTNKSQNKYDVNIIPASNVLYEENFFEPKAGTMASWSKTNAADVTISDNENSVFGYTKEYASKLYANGEYKATVAPAGDKRYTNDLEFTFRGMGFDLMAQCGANTGTLMVIVKDNQTGKVAKRYMVNTAINDADLGTIYQVPVIHNTTLGAGTYDVIVRGVNVDYSAKSARMAYSMRNSVGTANDAAYNAMIEMGMTDEEIAETEFINVNDMPMARSYALRNAPAAAPAAAGDKIVAVDSFRVYRSSNVPKEGIYPADEMNVTYTNVLSATESQFTAYMESVKDGVFGVTDYLKQGGPANEIYLKPNTAIAIKVPTSVAKTHVSLRAVSAATTAMINNKQESISHGTEMYYEATPENGIIVIANRGSSMLAVANVKCAIEKITDTQMPAALAMVARMMAAPITKGFAPARFDVQLNVIKTLFNQYATLKVKTSDDVAYITVNGERVDSNNVNLHKWGVQDFVRFTLRKTFKKNEAILFEVVAYDKDGNASEPVIK